MSDYEKELRIRLDQLEVDEPRAVQCVRFYLEKTLAAVRAEGYREGISKADGMANEVNITARDNRALRAALEGLLLSADASWEATGAGHDWREACEAARAALQKAGRLP